MSTTVKIPRIAFNKLLLNEARLALRVPAGIVTGLGLPLLLLIILGSVPALGKATKDLGGQSYFALSLPILLSLIIVSLGALILPRALVTYRETGILRRLSTTPVPPFWLLAAQTVVNLALVIVGLVVLMVVGVAALGLHSPKDWPGFLVALLVTISSMFAVGLWIAAVARNSGVAQSVGGGLFYASLFFGGIWIPRPIMPHVLVQIGDWTPLGSSVAGIQDALQGTFPTAQSLLCLVGYTLLFSYLALRYFRWE